MAGNRDPQRLPSGVRPALRPVLRCAGSRPGDSAGEVARGGCGRVAFARADCRPCPIRAQCTTAAPHLGRVLEIHPEPIHTTRMRMQAEQDTPQWRETYRARAGIEGTVSQAVRGPGLRRSRYRGLAKTHLQNVLTGMAINISRLGTHFDTTPRPAHRPTRIHALCTQHGIATAA
ncbi:transposase [Kitasatospora sp. NPDC048194]|uniref:transposase n=1 Tax=Kitasatospora sp. NPDC048194 TaxID=3364045 RepID=UPI0037169FE8